MRVRRARQLQRDVRVDRRREPVVALSASVISELADVVDDAQRNATEIVKLTDGQPDMDVADGYAVQAELARRWQADGRRLTGYKGGLTSKAKMVQMGLDTPVFGVLMGDTCVPDGDVVDMSELIHPKVEAEIAFVTSRELSGDVSIDEVLAATEFVLPAIEVIDSRFKDFKFDIQSVDRRQHIGRPLRGRRLAASTRRARPAAARRRDGTQR